MVNKDNIYSGLLTGCLGSVGDIISRIMFKNCSIDKLWSMMFVFPPMSFISGGMHMFGYIESGIGTCSSEFDIFLFIIPFICILMPYLLEDGIKMESELLRKIITFIILLTIFFIATINNIDKSCNSLSSKFGGINSDIELAGLIKTLMVIPTVFILDYVAPYLQNIPMIGLAARIWLYMDKIKGSQYALFLTIAHYVFNLYDNIPANIKTVCETSIKPES